MNQPNRDIETGAEMIATKELRARGWTGKMIQTFCPVPNALRRNPHYPKSGAPMKLYDLARIEAVEATAEFMAARAEAAKRQASALKAVQKKRERTKDWARGLPAPELPDAPRDELTHLAMDWHNDYHPWRTESAGRWASMNDPEEVLARIQVEYILFKLSDYERRVRQAFGHVGADEIGPVIKETILTAVAAKYPWLRAACAGQIQK